MKFFTRRWLLHAILSAAISTLVLLSYLKSDYNVYSTGKLIYLAILTPLLFLPVSIFSNGLIYPLWQKIDHSHRMFFLIITVFALMGILWLVPPPEPDLPGKHHLVISATGRNNDPSTGTQVELRDLRFIGGRQVPGSITMTPDWIREGDVFISNGAADSRLEVQGDIPVGVLLHLRYQPTAGIIRITWDGVEEELDLFKRRSIVTPMVLRGGGIFSLRLDRAAFSLVVTLLYSLGIATVILVGLMLIYGVAGQRSRSVTLGFAFVIIALLFCIGKLNYLQVDEPHAMLDSFNYVATADEPITSPAFWFGIRPFTMPLAIKAMGIHTGDFKTGEQLARWARFQTVFSAVCWLILAAAAAYSAHSSWLKVALFALVLSFGLTMEVSLWDALLLSESLSFSLLALMFAGLIWMLTILPNTRNPWLRWGIVFLTLIVVTLYIFVRDSNGYFALVLMAILIIGVLLTRGLSSVRWYFIACTALVMVIFAAQYLSMSSGNRWQILIYDHLAMRILKDPKSTDYFARAGLPVTEKLLSITAMNGVKYFPLLRDSQDFQPVRDWVNCCSKSVYVRYLLSNPVETLSQPFQNWHLLAVGSIWGYRNPRDGVVPVPDRLMELRDIYFSRSLWVMSLLILAIVIGMVIHFISPQNHLWILVAAAALAIIPMMYLVWYGNPMEIERHAAQIIIQIRLAGWLALLLLFGRFVDWLSYR